MADERLVDLAVENHELRLPHERHGERLAALEAELAGLRAEIAAHREGPEHHEHAAEEFEEYIPTNADIEIEAPGD